MEKEELFSWYIQKYENKEVMLYIKKLNFPQEFMMVLDKKRPKFQNTDLNKRILADYKRRGWITRIDPEDGMLRVNGRKILPL
jgi:2-C-methyl-D-erythritol 4-phosphate cytidylyltransferase